MDNSVIQNLLAELDGLGIYVYLQDGKLKLRTKLASVPSEQLARIKAQKDQLIAYMQQHNKKQGRLSCAQQRIWFISQYEEQSNAYNMAGVVKLSEPVAVHQVQRAIDNLLKRHEVLRSNFMFDDQGAIQRVNELPVFTLQTQHIIKSETKPDIIKRLDKELKYCFDLEHDLLLRATLFVDESAQQGQWLYVAMHHIVADGWSVGLFIQALLNELKEQSEEINTNPLQYLDYVHWEQQYQASDEYQNQLNYWCEQLTDIDFFELPTSYPRTASKSYHGSTHHFNIDKQRLEAFNKQCNALEVTQFVGLLSVFYALLHRYSQKLDITLGVPVLNRSMAEFESMIGCFINTLPLRVKCDESATFLTLTNQVKETVKHGLANQNVAVEDIIRSLDLAKSSAHSALFQVLFNYNGVALDTLSCGDLSAQLFPVDNHSAKFDLTLNISQTESGLAANIDYCDSLFDAQLINDLSDDFVALVTAFHEQTDGQITQLQLPSLSRVTQLLDNHRQTGCYSALEAILAHAQSQPEKIALLEEGTTPQQLSFAELDRQSAQVAYSIGIQSQFAGNGPIALLVPRTINSVVAMLAVLRSGHAYLPIEHGTPVSRIIEMLQQAQCNNLIVIDGLSLCDADLAALNNAQINNHRFGQLCEGDIASSEVVHVDKSDCAYVMFTSGSTGTPKGVMISHHALNSYVAGVSEVLDLSSQTRSAVVTGLATDLCLTGLYPVLAHGGCVALIAPNSEYPEPKQIVSELCLSKANFIKITPSFANELLPQIAELEHKPTIEQWVLGGEALTDKLVTQIKSNFPKACIVNHYGPTETCVGVTCNKLMSSSTPNWGSFSIGKPLCHVEVKILNDRQQCVPVGMPGELYIGGQSVALGYINAPQLSEKSFITLENNKRFYRSGDRVRLNQMGEIEYLGRLDNQPKVRGYRVDLTDIEAKLNALPEVKAAAVVCQSNNDQTSLIAHVVAQHSVLSAKQQQHSIKSALKLYLPEPMIPNVIVVHEQLPMLANGKIDRNQLLQHKAPLVLEDSEANSFAKTPLQNELVSLFRQIVGNENIGIHDDFFAIGGHSLLAMRLLNQIRGKLGCILSLKEIFANPTVAELAHIIELQSHQNNFLPEALAQHSLFGEHPMSFSQQRLWFVAQMQGHSSQYNLQGVFKLTGQLDINALTQAFSHVVQQQSILRFNYRMGQQGQAVQYLNDEHEFNIIHHDLSIYDVNKQASEQEKAVLCDYQHSFDLESDLMLRVTLLKLSEQQHTLIVTMHHIVSDGWSIDLLCRYLSQAYQSIRSGEPISQAPQYSYIDYVYWQRDQQATSGAHRDLDYWRAQLSNAPKVHELPTDRDRSNKVIEGGALYCQRLPNALTQQLREFVKSSGHTLFVTLQTVFAMWLSRVSNQHIVVMGTPVSGRARTEFESIIGNFINTLVLNSEFDAHTTFEQALSRSKVTLNEALKHQQLPFDALVDALAGERNLAIHPLMQIVFRVNNQVNEALELDALQVNIYDTQVRSAKLDLEVSVIDDGNSMVMEWLYDTALWDNNSIVSFFEQYCHVLAQCIANQTCQIKQLELCSPANQQQLLAYAQTLEVDSQEQYWHQRFSAQAKVQPNAIAVREGELTLSYEQLDKLSNQLAQCLVEMAFEPQSRIGILLPSCAQMVVAVLAILKAQHIYVPLHKDIPAKGLAEIVDDADMVMILAFSEETEKLIDSGTDFLLLDDIFDDESNFSAYSEAALDTGLEALAVTAQQDTLCYIIYTSGSTGKPKGVAITHTNLNGYLQHACDHYLSATSLRGSVISTPLAFDATVTSLIPMLICGGGVELLKEGPEQLSLLVSSIFSSLENKLFKLTPAHLRIVLALSARLEPCDKEHTLVIGGEALSADLLLALRAKLPRCRWVNEYGPTETTVGSSVYIIDPDSNVEHLMKAQDVPIGLPIAQAGMLVVDQYDHIAPINVEGELLISGSVLSPGYINREQLNSEKFVVLTLPTSNGSVVKQRFYRTGDKVRWQADSGAAPSYLRYCGRQDNVVKLRGYRIDIGAICHHLLAIPEIIDCAVTLDDVQGQLCAHYVSASNCLDSEQRYKQHLAEFLPSYMVPSQFHRLDALPLTSNAKVDENALKESLKRASSQVSERIELTSLSPLQAYLLQLFREILKRDDVGLHDNFFELGGHSLLAIRLISHIRDEKQLDVTLEQLFKTPSISALAQALEHSAKIAPLDGIVQVGRTQRLPLSYAQQRLWLIEQVQQGSMQYHMPASFEFNGQLDVSAFEQALLAIIKRHEVLRSIILPGSSGEQPEQLVNDHFSVPLQIVDLSSLDKQGQEERWHELMTQATLKPFDLSSDLLIRVLLVRLGTQRHKVHFNMHHIASDGWSMAILLKEFIAFYRHFSKESGYQLAMRYLQSLPVQYADFAHWQRQDKHQQSIAQSLSYWQSHLQDYPPLHQLPLDYPRPALQQLSGDTFIQYLSIEQLEAIKHQCTRQGVTLFMWLHSVFSLTVMRFSQTSDVMTGSPVAGREHAELADLIGFFVNTLVIRARADEHMSFVEFLTQQKQVVLDAFKHQAVPFEQLVETLNPERDLGHQPLFQILFALQNNEVVDFSLPALDIEQLPDDGHTMKFDLEVNAMESAAGISLQWNFATSLFKKSSIKLMANAFNVMINALLENPERSLDAIPVMSAEQQTELLQVHTHQRAIKDNTTLLARFDDVATRSGHSTAVIAADNTQLSYSALQHQARQLAAYIKAQGVNKGDNIAICLPASSEMVVAMLAVWQLGCTYVPIDPKLPSQRIQFILQDCQARALIVDKTSIGLVTQTEHLLIVAVDDAKCWQETPTVDVKPNINPDAPAYVIYTSGTTGQPKGVAISHNNLALYLAHVQDNYLNEALAYSIVSTPLAFDATVTSIWGALLHGLSIKVVKDDDTLIETLSSELFSQPAKLFKLTPAHLQGILSICADKEALSEHTVVVGGEALATKMLEQLGRRLPNVLWVNEYGPTETTVGTCVYFARKEQIQTLVARAEHSVPIGRAIANTQLVVLDAKQSLVPLGVVGELYIAGKNLANGYLGQAELSGQKFVSLSLSANSEAQLYYKTGDKVRWLTDDAGKADQLQFYGRTDHQVKLRGYRIELGEINHFLNKLPNIKEAAVALNSDSSNLEAYIVLTSDAVHLSDKRTFVLSASESEPLLTQLAEHLPTYMLPQKFVVLEKLPLTNNGKVDLKALQKIANSTAICTENVAPRNEFEQTLQRIFAELLNVENLGITDNFFALGGHSLLATQCAALVKEQLEIDMPVRVLFERPTIAAISQWYAIYQAVSKATPSDSQSDTSQEMFL
ncbi:non-ribosomal peptide synthetase [Pseudoalteromonas byunsanensis]|nr:non-ribosomal peptide synthetase [Pseudoalteromonas byunsanensis]